MSKFNLQSFAFVLVILLLTLFSRSGGETFKGATADIVEKTSLTAGLMPAAAINPLNFQPSVTPFSAILEAPARIIAYAKPEPFRPVKPRPDIKAAALLIRELTTQSLLAQENAFRRWPLASLTKLMTAVVAAEIFQPQKRILITREVVETPGSAGGFKDGEIYAAQDLIKAALIISSNDAAEALAYSYGRDEFIRLMQAKADELGLNQTSYFDPTGISVLNQSAMADLEKLADYILKHHRDFFEISSLTAIQITELKNQIRRTIINNNQFAGRPDFWGGKTGYTDDANGNLLSLFRNRNREFLIIIFGTADRFEETEKLYQWAKEIF